MPQSGRCRPACPPAGARFASAAAQYRWRLGYGALARQVVRQMPQRQRDHVVVVRVLFARDLRQVEPEAMDELNIVLSKLGYVRAKGKDVCPAVRSDNAKAELTPRPVRHLLPSAAEPSVL
jgi:hypothetical protein